MIEEISKFMDYASKYMYLQFVVSVLIAGELFMRYVYNRLPFIKIVDKLKIKKQDWVFILATVMALLAWLLYDAKPMKLFVSYGVAVLLYSLLWKRIRSFLGIKDYDQYSPAVGQNFAQVRNDEPAFTGAIVEPKVKKPRAKKPTV